MKPLLLIDVDGVLNCFGSLWSEEYDAEHFLPIELAYDRYPIRCRKQTADRIARLLEVYEPVWATAWQEHAHPWWGPRLGLGEEAWPHLEFIGGYAPLGGSWKLPTIYKWALEGPGAGRPLAWIDDDIQEDAFRWAIDRSAGGIPTLAMKTRPERGLGHVEESRLLAFAEQVARMEQRP